MASWKDAFGVVAKIAPTIASATLGPLGGSAVTAIESALGVPSGSGSLDKRLDGVAAVLSGATPDQLLQLKKADQDYQAKLAELNLDAATLSNQDRDSARKREQTVKDLTPRVLAYFVVAASVGIGYGILFHKMSADSAIVGMISGFIFREAAQVLSYYFGSSSESSKQTDLLAQAPAIEK